MTLVEMVGPSLQERYSPKSICFGCGPANPKGLHIRSFVSGLDLSGFTAQPSSFADLKDREVIAEFTPEAHHQAFPGVLNGGIVGALLDCHSNWSAAWVLLLQGQKIDAPCTVTADFHVKLRAPTPVNQSLVLKARVLEIGADRAKIVAELWAGDKKTATCEGTFVSVGPEHPAYHRW